MGSELTYTMPAAMEELEELADEIVEHRTAMTGPGQLEVASREQIEALLAEHDDMTTGQPLGISASGSFARS